MLATLTSKGQITVPKEIRDALALDAGATLDFSLQPDGTLVVRPLKRSVTAIVGLLQQPAGRSVTVQEMDRAVGAHLAEKDQRIRRAAGVSKPRKPRR